MKLKVEKEGELLDYLYNNLDMPKKRIKQYLTHGSIFVNNNRTTKYNYKLVPGMSIVIDTDSKNKKTLPFDILFEDEHIIVVNKPSGLLTIATEKEKDKTLYHIVREYLVSKNQYARVFIVHRLDKDTSGIVIFAKNDKIKKIMQDNWENVQRYYYALCHGNFKCKSGTIINYLKETKTFMVYDTKNEKNGDKSITKYEVIDNENNKTLVNINILTGKKNQIRVAMQSINHPIYGDKKYGKKDGMRNLCLHAYKVIFTHPITKEKIVIEAKMPKYMNIKKES